MNRVNAAAQLARVILGASSAFLLACCATKPEIASDYDRSANFAIYHTFTLMHREHPAIPNPLVAIRAEEDITLELQRRGYTLTADPTSADFTVDFTIGAAERTDISSYPAAYSGPWFLGGPYWGGNINVRQYREGTLAIDIFDGHTHRPVWHGWAHNDLTHEDLEQPAEPVSKAVSSVLARFPPS